MNNKPSLYVMSTISTLTIKVIIPTFMNDIAIFESANGEIHVQLDQDTVWLTQK